MRVLFAAAFALAALGWGHQAHAVVASTSFSGNVCTALDSDPAGNLDDCNTIDQGNGNALGVFTLTLDNLLPAPVSDLDVTITVSPADLFGTSGGTQTNEFFDFSIDTLDFGRLFEGDTSDETAINASLGATVALNNLAATESSNDIVLNFTISQADATALLADNQLVATFDFSQDGNVNDFVDPSFMVSYVSAIPLPMPVLLLLSGVGVIGLLGRRRQA